MPKLFLNENTEFSLEVLTFDDCEDFVDQHWCDIHIKIENYYMKFDHVSEYLKPAEVYDILDAFNALLNDEIKEIHELRFIEPDISFILHPRHYLAPGKTVKNNIVSVRVNGETIDAYVEVIMNFPNKKVGYCNEKWSCELNRKEIITFCEQLAEEIKHAKRNFKSED